MNLLPRPAFVFRLPLLAALLASASCAQAQPPLPRYGEIEDLGAPLSSTQVIHGIVTRQQGRPVLCSTVSGDPAKFNVFDLESEKVLRSFDIPKGKTFWIHGADSRGDVYFAGYVHATLYRYSVETGEVSDLGPLFGEQAACSIAFDEEDNVYIGTYPNAKIIKYDRAAARLVDLGTKIPGEKYFKSMVYHGGHLYGGGMKERPEFVRVSLATGKVETLPSAGADVTAYYYASTTGDLIFYNCSLPGGGASLRVYDIAAGRWLDFDAKQFRGLVASPPMHGKVYYSADGSIWSFDLASRAAERTATAYGTGFRGGSVVTLSGDSRFAEPSFVNVFYNGTLGIYNFRTGASKTFRGALDPAEGVISEIAPHGSQVMVGEFMGTRMVFFDPVRRKVETTIALGQPESVLSAGGKIYYGVYPAASVEAYDPALPPSPRQNPKVLFDLKKEGQSRPFGLAVSGSKLVVGMIADYGLTQGALAIHDLETGERKVLKNLLPDLSYSGLTTGPDGLVYGSTTVHGGLGGAPVAREALLFALDPQTGRIVRSRAPRIKGLSSPPTALGAIRFGPDGLLWVVSHGLVAAFDPKTLDTVKHVEVMPTNWLSQGMSWGRASLDFTAEGFIVCNPGGTLVLLDPSDLTPARLLPDAHTRRISQSIVAENGDIFFRSDLNSSRLFRLPRAR